MRRSGADKWSKVEVPVKSSSGSDVTVLLNRHFLIKALSFGLNHIEFIDAMSAMRFSEGGRQMIVMPTRPEGSTGTIPSKQEAPAEEAQENNGKGAAETVNSEAGESAASTLAASQERRTMDTPPTTNGNGSNGDHPAKPTIETAVDQVETIKTTMKSAVTGLNGLLDTLKRAQREQKSTVKEVQSVRSTLEKLQSVKI